jgi:hypothetical protein
MFGDDHEAIHLLLSKLICQVSLRATRQPKPHYASLGDTLGFKEHKQIDIRHVYGKNKSIHRTSAMMDSAAGLGGFRGYDKKVRVRWKQGVLALK